MFVFGVLGEGEELLDQGRIVCGVSFQYVDELQYVCVMLVGVEEVGGYGDWGQGVVEVVGDVVGKGVDVFYLL